MEGTIEQYALLCFMTALTLCNRQPFNLALAQERAAFLTGNYRQGRCLGRGFDSLLNSSRPNPLFFGYMYSTLIKSTFVS